MIIKIRSDLQISDTCVDDISYSGIKLPWGFGGIRGKRYYVQPVNPIEINWRFQGSGFDRTNERKEYFILCDLYTQRPILIRWCTVTVSRKMFVNVSTTFLDLNELI